MRTPSEIRTLLESLENRPADALEAQDLDFKDWVIDNPKRMLAIAIEMAVCMVNGGGGTVVFGVRDRVVGRGEAIRGVPFDVDPARLKRAIYDSTDPKIIPVFEELRVPEGTGRLLLMQMSPGMPPHTDSTGMAKIRVGKDCLPLTGSLRRKIAVETGENDYTAELLSGDPARYLSAAALEELRRIARRERAPEEILSLTDTDLLKKLGLIRDGRLSRAGVLIAGTQEAIREVLPKYVWTRLWMPSETEYVDRADGRQALPIALEHVFDGIQAHNPITTVREKLVHFEHRAWPEVALREALLNAFCHADLQLGGPILIKQSADRLEISNPGGFVGGITPKNILHHPPVARNPCLVDALVRLRIVNRSNLGVPRIFRVLLAEGKDPPMIDELGDSVVLVFRRSPFSATFRHFVDEEIEKGRSPSVDDLLILRFLIRHERIDLLSAEELCHRSGGDVREVLGDLQRRGIVERRDDGDLAVWHLAEEFFARLQAPEWSDWSPQEQQILALLRRHGEVRNRDLRELIGLNKDQAYRLMRKLRGAFPEIEAVGSGRTARYRVREESRD